MLPFNKYGIGIHGIASRSWYRKRTNRIKHIRKRSNAPGTCSICP
jgi:hypothetical protein